MNVKRGGESESERESVCVCVCVCMSVRERERGVVLMDPRTILIFIFTQKRLRLIFHFFFVLAIEEKGFGVCETGCPLIRVGRKKSRVRIPDKTQTLELPKHRKRANYVASFQVGQFFKVELTEVFGFD